MNEWGDENDKASARKKKTMNQEKKNQGEKSYLNININI